MPRFLRLLLPSLFLLAGLLHAQSARWEPSSGNIPRDQVSRLTLVFEGSSPKDLPRLPAVDGLVFDEPIPANQSVQITINGRSVSQGGYTLTYPVRPTRADGEVRIPAFTVETDRGALIVPAAGFRIAAATVGQSGQTLDQIATARFVPPPAPIWAGEVFRLGFNLEVDRRYATNSILGGALEWTPAPLVVEDWPKPSGSETSVNGQPRLLVSMETRAIAPSSTTATLLPIPAATQLVNLPTGQANPFSLFGQTTFDQYTLTTAPARIAINPLPAPAPADFIGAVGQFKLVSKIVPEKAAVGEPITWTITLEGTGNWPAIDKLRPRSLSRDFRVVTPRAQKTNKPDSLFDASLSEDLVLIPQKAGRSTLGPYTVSIFNPSSGAYETLRADPVTIEITPGTPSQGSASAQMPPAASNNPESPDLASSVPPAPAAPAPVAQLPSDPLPPGLLAAAPRPAWPHTLLRTLVILVLPAGLWLFFAARHARAHDPLRTRREAHAKLRQILSSLETGSASEPQASGLSSPPFSDLLLAWQHAVRALFALPVTTPTARDLPDPVWAALWIETERALYRPATTLSTEWFAQAWQAHERATPPSRSLLAALRPTHLFPRVLLWALVLHSAFGVGHSSLAAETGVTLYARGDFPVAETALRGELAAAPLDSAVRHNLALALAQQGKWDEAAAHAYAAALQVPGDLALERLFAATSAKAAYRLRLPPEPARLLSVHGWQTVALVSALALLGLAPLAYLLALYTPRPRLRLPLVAGHWMLAIASAALVASLLALRSHGPAADPSAVLVWRAATLRAVPTDVGEQKVTADLSAGTLARIDKEFLGWRRLVLADGNTGWVRAEPLVPLWR